MPAAPQPIANRHCQTGENPLWDPAHEALYWTDIPAGKLYKLEPRTGKVTQIYDGPPVGGFTQQADGTLLLFRVHDIARFYPDGHVIPLIEYPRDGANRFNDVIADPAGRVYATRLADDPEHGGLIRLDPDGTIHPLFTGCAIPNGMGFTRDEKTFYYTCSPNRTLYRFRYDRVTGELTDRETIFEGPEEEGLPDGLTIDETGHLWSARAGGGAIFRHSPDGKVVDKIPLPVEMVTSLCFGGPEMDRLYITTGGGDPEKGTDDGALFTYDPGCRGRLEYRSRILLD